MAVRRSAYRCHCSSVTDATTGRSNTSACGPAAQGRWPRTSIQEEVTTLSVSAGALRALGVQPAMGRWFADADQAPDAIETVILMDGYWARRFGRDAGIIGRQVVVDSRPRVVVGVMPASFRFLDETPDLVLPVRIDPATLTLGGFNYEGVARLAAGVTVEQAALDTARILPVWLEDWPSYPASIAARLPR